MKKIRAIIRGIIVFSLAILSILPGIFKSLFTKNWLSLALRMRKKWAIAALKILGVTIKKEGSPPLGGPFIFIGNHRSYLDPIIALGDIEALPIAKAEVSNWPIIGFGAKATGVVWVKRESKLSKANALKSMEQTLTNGFSVLVYPEGTTHLDLVTRNFQKGAFRLAANTGIPIVPIALHYEDPMDAWVGNDTFVPHFIRSFGKNETLVHISYGPAIESDNAEDLVTKAKNWIDGRLIEFRNAPHFPNC